ncbi:MAG: molecular chaperone TorD family protein [Acidobacteriia bacterium]|nr:molecular chaperone TorD family protein [Terriglobia bacterium]
MSSTTTLDKRELQLAKEAAEWRLASMLFECPSDAWRAQITALATEVGDAELKSATHDALEEAEEGLFHYIFGPGGPAPAREASYHQTVELGYLMSEIQAYYNAFAYQPLAAEPPDHISVETGFIAYLKLKQAYALACGEAEHAAIASEAAQSFIKDHLAILANPLAGHLANSGITYLEKASAFVARKAGPLPVVAPILPILQNQQEEEEYSCGSSPCE